MVPQCGGKGFLGRAICIPMHVNLGIDSTDSATEGMCTTYVGLVLVKSLLSLGVQFTDYPNLIRLNPNIPFKTRGNGAIALRFDTAETTIPRIIDLAMTVVEDLAVFSDPQTNPGIALVKGEVPALLHDFYERALHRLLTVEDATNAAAQAGAFIHGYKNRLGVIGALAAIGEELKSDHTYELLAYREEEKWGTRRHIDPASVIAMDQEVEDAFFNYDYDEHAICIAPHSVCPVLMGIRGESAEGVREACTLVDPGETVSSYVIFRTNQHTSFHFEPVPDVRQIQDYSSVICEGTVATRPVIIRGGHVFFELENSGRHMCAAFEPTKGFRDVIRCLQEGDRVRVYGGVKSENENENDGTRRIHRTINLERIDIIDVVTSTYKNPVCPVCSKSMKSRGRGQGYECKRCGQQKKGKELVPLDRHIRPGSYEPPPSAWRHLYRFISRGHTNSGKDITLIEKWIK